MNRKLWYLKQLNLFKTLSSQEIKKLSDHFVGKDYGKRQVILEPEDKDKVFILKSGRVEIYQLTLDGKKIIIDVLGPGNVFGDLGIDEPSEHFVEASTNSFVCIMKKGEFFDMVTKSREIAQVLIRELFAKIVESEEQVAALASDSITAKIKNLLLRLAKKHGKKQENDVTITTKFTHEQLADMIGVSRPTMTELLNQLSRQKVIKRDGKIISFDHLKLADL